MTKLQAALIASCIVVLGCGDGAADRGDHESLSELRVRGAAAFFETLYGEADRRQEAIDVALTLREHDPDDFSTYWRPAAMRMLGAFRGWQRWRDFAATPPETRADVALARQETAEAIRLADVQGVTLPIMTTWPGMTTFLDGLLKDDVDTMMEGVELMRSQAIIQPTLGNLMFVEIVGQAAPLDSPLMAESVEHARRAVELGARNGCTVNRDACGNSASAPHNLEGGLLVFADAYLKSGDLEAARSAYVLTRNLAAASDWPYRSLVDRRLESMPERLALYRNDDPGDDPLFGVAGSLCEGCHDD